MILYSAYLPTNHLHDFADLMDYHFLEPNPDKRYTDYYYFLKDGKSKFLDNGLIEFGTSWEAPELMQYAALVDPTLICPPDRLGDWEFNSHQALEWRRLAPPHAIIYLSLAGPTPAYFSQQTMWAWDHNFRPALPYRLNRCWDTSWFSMGSPHLFGLRMPEDFSTYPNGTTIDTVEPIAAAMRGISYKREGGIVTVKRPKGYAEFQFNKGGMTLARENIEVFKKWLNRGGAK